MLGGLLFRRILRGALLLHLRLPALRGDLLLLLSFHLLALGLALLRGLSLALEFELLLLRGGVRLRVALAGHALLIGLLLLALRLSGTLLLLLHFSLCLSGSRSLLGLLLPYHGRIRLGLALAGDALLAGLVLLCGGRGGLSGALFFPRHLLLPDLRLFLRGILRGGGRRLGLRCGGIGFRRAHDGRLRGPALAGDRRLPFLARAESPDGPFLHRLRTASFARLDRHCSDRRWQNGCDFFHCLGHDHRRVRREAGALARLFGFGSGNERLQRAARHRWRDGRTAVFRPLHARRRARIGRLHSVV